MSQENVDVYFAAKDRLAAGDHDGFARLLHPDVTATVTNFPEPGPFLGRDALIAQLEGLAIEFDGQRYSNVEIIADRDDWIVLTYRWSVQGSRSGVGVDADIAVAFRVNDGQIIEVHWRESGDEALEAAGLREKAISQENVEIVRRVYSLGADAAGIVRGDYDDVFRDYFDPDCELLPPSVYPDVESSYRGVEGLRRWFGQMDEIWDDFRLEPERYFDAGARVVVFARVSGAAKGSGPTLAISSAHVLTLRDGRITRSEIFLDRAEALEAVGLRE